MTYKRKARRMLALVKVRHARRRLAEERAGQQRLYDEMMRRLESEANRYGFGPA